MDLIQQHCGQLDTICVFMLLCFTSCRSQIGDNFHVHKTASHTSLFPPKSWIRCSGWCQQHWSLVCFSQCALGVQGRQRCEMLLRWDTKPGLCHSLIWSSSRKYNSPETSYNAIRGDCMCECFCVWINQVWLDLCLTFHRGLRFLFILSLHCSCFLLFHPHPARATSSETGSSLSSQCIVCRLNGIAVRRQHRPGFQPANQIV